MISRLWTAFLFSLACASTSAWLVALMHEKNVRPVQDLVAFFKKQSKAGRVILGAAALSLWAFASVKPNDDRPTSSVDKSATLNTEVKECERHGEITTDFTDSHGFEEWEATNRHESAQISIRDNSCQFVDKNSVSSDSNPTHGYALSRIGTNEVFSFDPPEGAVIAENWRRRGAATDWRRLSLGGWEFPFGGSTYSNLVVFANGTILLSTNAALRPVTASLGLVPERGWGGLEGLGGLTGVSSDSALPTSQTSQTFQTSQTSHSSLFWHSLTPSNTLQLTWRDALLHRAAANPVSLQIELNPNGNFAYRYDFSALASDDILTNVMAGVEGRMGEKGRRKREEGRGEEGQTSSIFPLASYFPSPRDITSLTFRSDDERRCDAARDAFEAALGGLDPFACPAGSTNTVWEHLAYTGTTNGAFAYPQSTERTAVLRVTVAGAGRGELLVGNRAVPLVGMGASTDYTDSHGSGEGFSTNLHESSPISIRGNSCQFVDETTLDGMSATLNAEGSEVGRHGETSTDYTDSHGLGVATNLHESSQISIRENSCQFVDKNSTGGVSTPCLPTSIPSVLSAAGSTPPTLLLPVPRGQTVPLYVRASGSLSVSLSSADFAFGRLPDLAAHRPTGRINFPNVSATVPCFHDYRMACGAQHGEDGGRETRRGRWGHDAAKFPRHTTLPYGERSVPPSLRHLRVKRKQYALRRGRKDAVSTNLHEFSRIGVVGSFGRRP